MAIHKDSIVDVDLTSGTIHRSFLNHSIGMNDSDGDFFGVRVFKSGAPVDLTNVSVQGHFNPPVGAPIFLNAGNYISGNVATVRLPQACYNYEGPFSLAIKLVTVNETVTVRIVDGMVDNTYVEGSVAPTGTVPTYQEVLAEYDQMVAATATANAAAQTAVNTANAAATTAVNTANAAAANCATIVAAPYSNSATYAVGTYCTKDGKLYECTTAITTAEEWTAGHWTETKVGPEVSDLKSALSEETRNLWVWGDQTATGVKTVTNDANLPAGSYVLSANVTKTGSQGSVRMVFYKNSISSSNELANPYLQSGSRNAASFTLAEKADIIRVYSSATSTGTATANWHDIQIESGTQTTEYTGSLTAVDYNARNKGANLDNAVNADLLGSMGLIAAEFKPGIIATPAVGNTGSITRAPSSSGKYSAVAEIEEGQNIYIKASAGSTSYKTYAILDENLEVLERGESTALEKIITATEDAAYIVVNSLPGKDAYCLIDTNTRNNKIASMENDMNEKIGQLKNIIDVTLNPIALELEAGYIWTPDVGTQTTLERAASSKGIHSAYHEVEPGQVIYVSLTICTQNVRPYAFLDEDLYVISRSANKNIIDKVTVPDGAKYVVINSKMNDSVYAIILEEADEKIEDSINVGMFNKIAVCGYSWDSGYAYKDNTHSYTRRSRSWGAILANMYGIDYACYGVPSGTTCAPDSPWSGPGHSGAKCWQTEDYGLPKLLNEPACDLYWFHLFGNDYKKLGMDYLGTIDDIKEDYTQNADTFYGNYGRIMAQIKSHAPNAKFIFSYREKSSSNTTCKAFAAALREIAEYFEVPYVNWYDDAWFSVWIDKHFVQAHPTFADYSGMAKAADRLFAKCAKANWNYFKNFVPAADT